MSNPANRIASLVVDAADAEALGQFWADVLGWRIIKRGGYGVTIGAEGTMEIDFRTVPDRSPTTKNRLHLDLEPLDRSQAAELDRLLGLGAQPVDVGQRPDASWHVLADPEGNEFCLCRPDAPV